MITTADYLIKASVGKVEYFFEHNENDVWDVLESFWHDDYPEVLDGKDGSALFPMDVYAMHDGLVITSYRFTFSRRSLGRVSFVIGRRIFLECLCADNLTFRIELFFYNRRRVGFQIYRNACDNLSDTQD